MAANPPLCMGPGPTGMCATGGLPQAAAGLPVPRPPPCATAACGSSPATHRQAPRPPPPHTTASPLRAGGQASFPLPYYGEQLLLSRGGVELGLRGAPLRTRGNKWAARGTVYISSMRVVFIADKADNASGLQAFELPLAYITDEAFAQVGAGGHAPCA